MSARRGTADDRPADASEADVVVQAPIRSSMTPDRGVVRHHPCSSVRHTVAPYQPPRSFFNATNAGTPASRQRIFT
ncbi:hypothetical protein CU102_03105 [Phyllobacterium brassicacearum]|uniref:Uncharacterized protein n=1 Tax=Phyllobacterium brassicacearum TaxID=314235 RepID=A0A2P7BUF5_9HYPH|nr:hypothetical protein CU102_03105 [Phyllobacterium brassicacearum]TDQ34030.1 hypothetical protein DEV91_104233 [Phyllobacterium brassicacearum]